MEKKDTQRQADVDVSDVKSQQWMQLPGSGRVAEASGPAEDLSDFCVQISRKKKNLSVKTFAERKDTSTTEGLTITDFLFSFAFFLQVTYCKIELLKRKTFLFYAAYTVCNSLNLWSLKVLLFFFFVFFFVTENNEGWGGEQE